MAQHDYVIDNSTGANVRADINSALQAIVTNNSGSSAPSATFPFMLFADSAAGTMKIRNAADNAFIELFQLDGTFTLEDGSASTPALAFRDDLNTGIFSGGADEFNISTGGTERFVINSSGKIGIGTTSPAVPLHINSNDNSLVYFQSTDAFASIEMADTNGSVSFLTTLGRLDIKTGGDASTQATNAITSMTIKDDGQIGIGTTSPTARLHVIEPSSTPAVKIKSGLDTNQNTHITMFNDNEGGTLALGVFGSAANTFGAMEAADGFVSANNELAIIAQNNSGQIRFGIGATPNTKMLIDSIGRVGIGTTSPTTLLTITDGSITQTNSGGTENSFGTNINITTSFPSIHLNDTNSENDFLIQNQNGVFAIKDGDATANRLTIASNGTTTIHQNLNANSGIDVTGAITGTGDLTIDTNTLHVDSSNNRVGIGTSSPASLLHVSSGTSGDCVLILEADTDNNDEDDNPVIFFRQDGGIDCSAIGMGLTSTSSDNFLTLANSVTNGSINFQTGTTSGFTNAVERMRISANGSIGAPNGTNIFNASDSRVKKNVVDLDKGLSAIKSLRPVSFNWIDGFCDEEKNTLYGFIAQEVQAVDSNLIQDFANNILVNENTIENVLRVNEKFLVPMLVKAVQELEAKVAALETA